jgi:hypothetical protein
MVYPVVLKRRNLSVKLPGVTAHCAVNSVFIDYVLQNYWATNQIETEVCYEDFVCIEPHGIIYSKID